jgi:phosphate:Na+ symporter
MLLIELAGAVALLLWGLHMVHTGIVRVFGPDLRRILNFALRNRLSAFAAGLALTAILQSSTATALMTASLAAEGLIGLTPALAIMLGANVGTTLIVQVLSFNIYVASPFFLVAGVAAFKLAAKGRFQQSGRALIGFGLMILALHLLIESLAPVESSPDMRELLHVASQAPLVCILLAGALAWAAHSSVAVVLLVISLAHSGLITPEAALAWVLGANLGSAVNPLFEAGKASDLSTKRLPVGNLVNRVIGVVLVYPFLGEIAATGAKAHLNTALMASTFHVAFNLVFALLFIAPLQVVADLLIRFLPKKVDASDPCLPRYLNEMAVSTPSIALAEAVRETLRIVDLVEKMLEQVMAALLTNNRLAASRVSELDDVVDGLERAVRLYITRLTREALSKSERRRANEVMSYAINLEHIGDIIDTSLRETAVKKIKCNANFSREGAQEIAEHYNRVLKSLRVSLTVFVSGDPDAARRLLQEKSEMRKSERIATENHLSRLREGRSETLETTSMHVDALRDLTRIHSHICSIADLQADQSREDPRTEKDTEIDIVCQRPQAIR